MNTASEPLSNDSPHHLNQFARKGGIVKVISRFPDLVPFGIDALTGEACAYCYRILCDVTARGRRILLRALGIPDIALHAPWNAGTPEDPHIGSCMLAQALLEMLAVFALLDDGAREIWIFSNGPVIGFYPGDTDDDYRQVEIHGGVIHRKIRPAATDRQRHLMTGRLE